MESPFKGKSGLQRIINATGYSLAGLSAAWQNEAAFRQVALLAVVGIGVAIGLGLPIWSKAILIASHLMTLVIELFNSAIEAAVDHTSLERHPLAKRAKDLGSAAQMVGLTSLSITWLLCLYSHYVRPF
ncbi:diacylglycerol kinase [Parachitinimonas caeni]|uniref:Diacylglycerol kinase n=1 Tax=Parachitinimonas caeni TaxID=3031301 RepID=A0ABT7DRK0_9NEIS|nr:diacylglycerol kinase [Parachitinimonas caeni]MDK2122686.1 diacylglycerol kinase [Parachitinimonas caeni]